MLSVPQLYSSLSVMGSLMDINYRVQQREISYILTTLQHFAKFFSMADIYIDASSTDGMDTGIDVDDFVQSEDWSMKEYSLGKACFEFTLMTSMVASSDVDENWPEFDVRRLPLVGRTTLIYCSPDLRS
jgi:hypothetical protein